MDLRKIRDAAAKIDQAYKAAESAKLAQKELALLFPDELERRVDLGRALSVQAGRAKELLSSAVADLVEAGGELHEKWAEGERAVRGEGEFRAPTPDTGGRELLAALDPSYRARAPDLNTARNMGAAAFAAGQTSTPAQNAELMAYLRESTSGELGEGLPVLEAWTAGWHAANIAAPVIPRGARPALRVVPDADAEIEAIDRELEELEGPPYDHRPAHHRLQWLRERKGLYTAESPLNDSDAYSAQGQKDGRGPWRLTFNGKWLDRHGEIARQAADFITSGHAQDAAQKHHERARVTAEFVTDDAGKIHGPSSSSSTSMVDVLRLPVDFPGAMGKQRTGPAWAGAINWDALRKTVTGAWTQRGVEITPRAPSSPLEPTYHQKWEIEGLRPGYVTLFLVNSRTGELDELAGQLATFADARRMATAISEKAAPSDGRAAVRAVATKTPAGVKVDRSGWWDWRGPKPPPVYVGLPVSYGAGAHSIGGTVTDANKTRTRISVKDSHGDTDRWSYRKGPGAYFPVGRAATYGRLRLGKSVDYLDPGV